MRIYHYHPITGNFIGQGMADPDPMEAGNWLVPAHATSIAPPAAGDHEAAVFDNGGWRLVADYRGVTYWLPDGSAHTVEALGVAPPADALDSPPPPAIETLREGKIGQAYGLAKSRLNALVAGVSPGEMVPWLALEAEARAYLADPAGQLGPNMQAELGDRAPHELAASVIAKADALRAARAAIITARRRHVLAIQATANADELAAYDINTGWPVGQ